MRCTTCRKALILAFLLAGCRQRMANQPRYDTLEKSTFFADMLSARPLPSGVIPRSWTEPDDGASATRIPMQVTMDLLTHGRQRYDIYCAPCHDYVGAGNGMAARRGFRRAPASFHTEQMRSAPPGHFFDVISNGFGEMPSYADDIAPRDRWAIIAYIRALQLSQWATLEDVPPEERTKLQSGTEK